MPAAVHLLTGPAGSGKTARLLECFRAIQTEAFGTALWIVPSRRAADALRPNLAASGFGTAPLSLPGFRRGNHPRQ